MKKFLQVHYTANLAKTPDFFWIFLVQLDIMTVENHYLSMLGRPATANAVVLDHKPALGDA